MFAECKLVRGNKRSVIYDLPRNSYKLIPNDLFDILNKYKNNTIDDIKKDYEETQHKIIDEYFNMLIEKEFIFFCDKDELELFIDIEPEWDYPGQISNAILELPMPNEVLISALLSLDKLGCRFIQFRSLEVLDLSYVAEILNRLNNKDLDYIELISKWGNENIDDINIILQNNQRLRVWYFHGAERTNVIQNKKLKRQKIIFSNDKKITHSDFHVNSKFYFHVNIMLFFESLHYNNYYNRKVCISKEGYVKNCLSLDKNYGKITLLNKIENIIQADEYKLLWSINKDKIAICKDCEFRYMCVDSTPLEYKNEEWHKVNPCFYNPYNP